MAQEEKSCRIPWTDIVNSSNPEQYIFRQLQLNDIIAFSDKDKFVCEQYVALNRPVRKLHCIDDIETKERVYVQSTATAYPNCKCLYCSDHNTIKDVFHLDFMCQLMIQLFRVGAVPIRRVSVERNRVMAVIQLQREAERQAARQAIREAERQARQAAIREAERQARQARQETVSSFVTPKKEKKVEVAVEIKKLREVRLQD